MQSAPIRIGTRGSPLALVQAEAVRAALVAAGAADAEVVAIRTTGDRITDRPLAEAGGKGLFTKEIDEALLAGTIDIAVHSAKDMPTALPAGIVIAATLPRADVRDALIAPRVRRLADLPPGARLATSSLRRKAMALRLRPDLAVIDLRGNVETRLRRIAEGAADATLLAAAGLARLGLLDRAASLIEPEEWLPAVGQGVIAIAARPGDANTATVLARIDHADTSRALAAERSYLAVLDGSCRTPIGGLARISGGTLTFAGIIVRPDGSAAHTVAHSGPAVAAERIGAEAAADLLARAGRDFLAG